MFLPQTIFEYLENPMGKGSTAISNRKLIKDDLDNRLEKLLEKHKDFKKYFYHDAHDFFVHIIIPSESKERNNTYDVVIQFIPMDSGVSLDVNLNRYAINVFSNCPSFTYTYAYVYHDNNLIIDFLKNKYKSIVLQDNPVIKNPGEVINFEKSIYFACKYLEKNKHLLNKITWASHSKRINRDSFSKTIRNTDTIEIEIKKEQNRIAKEKKKIEEDRLKKINKAGTSKLRSTVNVITGSKVSKQRNDHKITPVTKISGISKLKKTIKKK